MAFTIVPQAAQPARAPSLLKIDANKHGVVATGPRESLIAEGLCSMEHFPKGRKRYAHGRIESGPYDWWDMRYLKGGNWVLQLSYRRSELDAQSERESLPSRIRHSVDYLARLRRDMKELEEFSRKSVFEQAEWARKVVARKLSDMQLDFEETTKMLSEREERLRALGGERSDRIRPELRSVVALQVP